MTAGKALYSTVPTAYRALLKAFANPLAPKERELMRRAIDLLIGFYRDTDNILAVLHAMEVARIAVSEIGLGFSSALAALLNGTIERKQLTAVELEKEFGPKVAEVVVGLTRISGIDPKDPTTQSELYRQMLISFSNDARVILIKLADSLTLMRRLDGLQSEQRLKYAWEAFHLFAPLAHRLGLYRIKSEMEDLAMKYIYPKEYGHIVTKLRETTAARNRFIRSFIAPIKQELEKRGFSFEIKGRTKSVYSIFRKMQKQHVDFEEVYDIFAIRIILDSKPENEKFDCWQVYSVVTDRYTPNTDRLRDWISVPKSNGYESLHTTVQGPQGKWVEVQIRTTRMDEIAEKGLAAHWKYKGIKQEQGIDEWVSRVRDILESSDSSPEDKVEEFRRNLIAGDIFVFTPMGDIRKLPQRATVLDFAFDIHSEIGEHCTGALINGHNASIRQELQNGDVVEIITSKRQKPKKDWLAFVTTSKAKTRIKQKLREVENREILQGREILLRRLKNWKIDGAEEAIRKINKHLKLKKPTDIFILIAQGKVDLGAIKTIVTAKESSAELKNDLPKEEATVEENRKGDEGADYLVIDEKLVNIDYKLAKCCNPIFGDPIFGFVTVNEGIKIHRKSCPNARQLKQRWGYRIVNARWKQNAESGAFQTTIRITGNDELGILNRISEVISNDLRVNMRNLAVRTSGVMFEATIQLFVTDTKHLEMLLHRLTQIDGISRAIRLK